MEPVLKDQSQSVLSRYRLDRAYLVRPDRKGGRPGIRYGVDEHGNSVLIKVWPKAGPESRELREIWRNEVRQLHRLGGYPGASESIASLQRADEDEAGFYLILEPGQRMPLATILKESQPDHWLKNPRIQGNRAALWRNLIRVSAGLQTLHDQGLLHKNINEWAILTSGDRDPDFQLTGFEWSVRISGVTGSVSSPRTRRKKSGVVISFRDDWQALGELVARLLDVSSNRLRDARVTASEVADHLNVEEIRLLRVMLRIADASERLDADVIERRVLEVLGRLGAQMANRSPQLHLVLGLGPNSQLTQRMREESGYIESGAIDEQIVFVRDDLADNPRLLALKSEWGESRIIVQGTRLTYRLKKFYPRAANSESTWDYAFCDTCEQNEPARTNILGKPLKLEANSLSILRIGEARHNYSRSRGKFRSWEELKRAFDVIGAPIPRERRFHQALALTQFIDTLFAAAESFPVEIVNHAVGESDDVARLTVRVREESEREQLSNALRLRPPAIRFREALMEERADGNWVLTESRRVGMQEPTDSEWSFESEGSDSEGNFYRFSGSAPPPPLREPLMISGDFVGRDIQFHRRLNALRALADHAELLWMLVDPRRRILDSHEAVGQFDFVNELDSSKREAIADVMKTVPLYLLQGPPGVGKTRIVRSLVKWVFKRENAARILLTAQSNAAVDHLLETLDETFQDQSTNLLTVRCRALDRQDAPSSYDVLGRANDLLADFATSDLVAGTSAGLRERVRGVASDLGDSHSRDRVSVRDGRTGRERQAVEGLVVRAANVVLATSNSRELERLVDERGQFDWTVVEEAGKALGVELLAPLLLSYRRLLIGDHRQLAPFGAERLISLLEDPASVKKAIQWGREFVSRALRDASTDEVLDEIDRDDEEGGSEVDFGELCSLALNAVLLFERLVEDEFEFQEQRPGRRKLARRLDQQHRMHPAIATLVSRCFYDGALISAAETVGKFEPVRCPVVSRDSIRLPEVPIVVVDMPYVQTTQEMTGEDAERHPRWSNPLEADATIKVLELLKTKPAEEGRTSLAVLSPYSRQVAALQSRLDEEQKDLASLNQFRPAVGSEQFCGTVDSFQGNEADVVVISLVRNNHHASVRGAFGFLSDRRRMNVLLSRAKWRLVLVFSVEFFKTVLASSSATAAGEKIMFMRELLSGLEDACAEGEAAVVPWERLRAGGGP